jgi:hypothetical protein
MNKAQLLAAVENKNRLTTPVVADPRAGHDRSPRMDVSGTRFFVRFALDHAVADDPRTSRTPREHVEEREKQADDTGDHEDQADRLDGDS